MAKAENQSLPGSDSYDRMIVLFSDVEMGGGGLYDDFPHSDFLGSIITEYLDRPGLSEKPIDFVFNGDTFDLLKTPYLGTYPHHITKDVAIGKMTSVAAAHPKFFEAISAMVDHGSGNKKAHFVLGNHDYELAFPKVQRFIKALCGSNELVNFPGFGLQIGPVFFEHGCQADPLFRVDEEKLFVEYDGSELLNLSWASVALLDVVIPMQPILYFQERLRPRNRVLELIPEIRELLMALAWKYWTRDFWSDLITTRDPLLKITWTMAKEMVRRITSGNPMVMFDKKWLTENVEKSDHQLYILGHLHNASGFYHGDKRVLQAGAFRNEYWLSEDGHTMTPALKPYYEIYLKDDEVVSLVTREVLGPARAQEDMPASIFDVVPKIKETLAEMGDQDKEAKRQKEQEKKEAKQVGGR